MTGKQDFRLNLKRSFLERREGKRRKKGADRGRERELVVERKWKSEGGRKKERKKAGGDQRSLSRLQPSEYLLQQMPLRSLRPSQEQKKERDSLL